MITIREAVIVEGKYDKIKLENLLDTTIIATDGFQIFKDKEKQALIRKLAEKRGIVIVTDSDSAGFMIRSFIGGSVDKKYIKHVYMPDLLGKEKRKAQASSEGKLGVEGIPNDVIITCFENAGIFCEKTLEHGETKKKITKADLYEDGFFGRPNSSLKKQVLLKKLSLPQKMSNNLLADILNVFLSFDQYKLLVEEINSAYNGGE